jgi:phosphoglycolate phosphatase
MREAGARPDETVMVGDSEIDVQIARRAGAWSLGCSFGFGASNLKSDPPDVLVTTPNEWAKLLCGSYIREAH